MKNNLFYHTVSNDKFHSLLIEASKKNLQKKLNIPYLQSKQITYSKIPSLRMFFFILKNILNLKIFSSDKFISLKYRDCEIGRYSASVTYRMNSVIDTKFIKFIYLIRNLIKSALIIDNGYKIAKRSKGIYIEHVGYFSGLYIKIFLKYRKIIYFNGWPRGFAFINFSKKKNRIIDDSKIIIIRPSKKKISNQIKKKVNKKLRGIISDPKKNLYYMRYANYKNQKSKYKFQNIDYVIYAHSFVDGQLFYGYDGFSNLFEWLDFTIDYLLKKKKKILVKGHPNFYNKTLGDISYQDSKLFEKIIKKYSNSNIIFINEALKNSLLLKNIDKKTIIISHHGTALLESTFLGYKTICSKYCIWDDKFHISNQWSNIKDYKRLLDKKYNSLRFFRTYSFIT